MTTNLRYEQIISTMPPGIEKTILQVLAKHIGETNRIARYDLVQAAFPDRWLGTAWKDGTEDRQVRKAIEELRQTWPEF